jgi:hypothetical protein
MTDFTQDLGDEYLDHLALPSSPASPCSKTHLYRLVGPECPPHIGAAFAELDGQLWQPTESGVLLLVVPEFAGDQLVDLLAYRPSAPSKVYLRTGHATVAGEDNLRAARFFGERILVHPMVEDYVRAGMTGCCVFNGDFERLIDFLRIDVSDAELAERIDRAHRAPPKHRPKIYVQQPANNVLRSTEIAA